MSGEHCLLSLIPWPAIRVRCSSIPRDSPIEHTSACTLWYLPDNTPSSFTHQCSGSFKQNTSTPSSWIEGATLSLVHPRFLPSSYSAISSPSLVLPPTLLCLFCYRHSCALDYKEFSEKQFSFPFFSSILGETLFGREPRVTLRFESVNKKEDRYSQWDT